MRDKSSETLSQRSLNWNSVEIKRTSLFLPRSSCASTSLHARIAYSCTPICNKDSDSFTISWLHCVHTCIRVFHLEYDWWKERFCTWEKKKTTAKNEEREEVRIHYTEGIILLLLQIHELPSTWKCQYSDIAIIRQSKISNVNSTIISNHYRVLS